jgi:hypothetical protein
MNGICMVAGLIVLLTILPWVGGGCSQERLGIDRSVILPNASIAEMTGDWDDVDAAVDAGGAKAEMAIVSITATGPNGRAYELRSIRDEPVWLVVDRLGQAGPGPIRMSMRCTVGRFGNPEAQRRLLGAVERRLRELIGDRYVPVSR